MKDKSGVMDAEQTLPQDAEPTMKDLMKLFVQSRMADQEIQREQLKQTRSRHNSQPPGISAYNPRGDKDFPMPELKFDVMAPWQLTKGKFHPLTVEEVQLMNRVTAPAEVDLELLDDTVVRCAIIAQKNIATGAIEKIAFMGQKDSENGMYTSLYTKERRSQIPAMVKLLHQVLDKQGTDYSDILTMGELKKRIALPPTHADHLAVSVGEA